MQGAYMGPDFTVLVTEYMDGGDLMSNIAVGRVSWWKRGRKIAIDVAKGLTFLHARRIVHFDLKCPNILLARLVRAHTGSSGGQGMCSVCGARCAGLVLACQWCSELAPLPHVFHGTSGCDPIVRQRQRGRR